MYRYDKNHKFTTEEQYSLVSNATSLIDMWMSTISASAMELAKGERPISKDLYIKNVVDIIVDMYFASIRVDNSYLRREMNKVKDIDQDILKLIMKKRLSSQRMYDTFCLLDKPLVELIKNLLIRPPRDKEKYYLGLEKDLEFLEKRTTTASFVDHIESFKKFFITLTSTTLDLLFIIKIMTTTPSMLSIGYFGNNHTNNIIDFLVSHLNYTSISSNDLTRSVIDPETVSRCIPITSRIDLKVLLEIYGKQRRTDILQHNINLKKERIERIKRSNIFIQTFYPIKEEVELLLNKSKDR